MSHTLRIEFESDMPTSAVEIVGPNLESVRRIAVSPGATEEVDVPSALSFVRIHLPSGRIVALNQDENLNYRISRADLDRQQFSKTVAQPNHIKDMGSYHAARAELACSLDESHSDAYGNPHLSEVFALVDDVHVKIARDIEGQISIDQREVAFLPTAIESKYGLSVTAGEVELQVSIPGNTVSAYVRIDDLDHAGRLVSVRVSGASDVADSVGAYLARGDYYSAQTMTSWAEQSEELLRSKLKDPFAAAVAGYLLLRLERFDLMHDWARNLANWFPGLADGCIIWANQILQQNGDAERALEYLHKAIQCEQPTYTEGLRLLISNLCRMGSEGKSALKELRETGGQPVWNSPFTARVFGVQDHNELPISFDVGHETIF